MSGEWDDDLAGPDGVALLDAHLPFAVRLVKQLTQEIETADLSDPAERKSVLLMLNFAQEAARAARGLLGEARALRGLRSLAAEQARYDRLGYEAKRPRLDPKQQRRLASLEGDAAVRAVAEGLEDPDYCGHVEGSATMVEYACRHLRASLDRAARSGGR